MRAMPIPSILGFYLCLIFSPTLVAVGQQNTGFKVIVLAELGDQHRPYVDAAKIWLRDEAIKGSFTIDYIVSPDSITDLFLSKYQLFIQLNFPPYGWSDAAKGAFERYVEEGRGGWIGIHHATLLGDFNGYTMWPWFSEFMGGIRFTNYIPGFASAKVVAEDNRHPCMKNVPSGFLVEKDEWYTYDNSPRPNVHVLASVEESSYSPDSNIKMGDHPVVWINEQYKARNIYIFMGHDPGLFKNTSYSTLLRNAITWAASANVRKGQK
ncbi:MAG: ThuA domain-containing protein [Cyclobacteriaceae bacterium]|nr:ThuA domain-containing protein [Cyclobacteriaceae bacterium]MDH4295926.1 ThuA domain-containing protein [Cyclobacteriaceae bacterium]MDH5249448.1 ThuA domain-containing protein [Cyclobacteriaceae bacterium]